MPVEFRLTALKGRNNEVCDFNHCSNEAKDTSIKRSVAIVDAVYVARHIAQQSLRRVAPPIERSKKI